MLLSLALPACEVNGSRTLDPLTTGDTAPVETGGVSAERCSLDPGPVAEVRTLRADASGRVYLLDVDGRIYRYVRGEQEDCTLEGSVLREPGDLDGATDLDLDGKGTLWALVFFSTLARLDASGEVVASCEVEAGHGVAVSADGTRATVAAVGDTEVAWVDLDEEGCAERAESLSGGVAIGVAPRWADDRLLVDAHDPRDELPPGFVLDGQDASLVLELGTGEDPVTGDELAAIADVLAVEDGYYVAGSPDGDLWFIDGDGKVERRLELDPLLDAHDTLDGAVSAHSIDAAAGGGIYVAASGIDQGGVWLLR